MKAKTKLKMPTKKEDIDAAKILNFIGFNNRLPAYPKDRKGQKLWEHIYN